MEPVAIAIVSTVVFGVVTALSVFVRQLLLSRDKALNEKAQERALKKEAKGLAALRKEMQNRGRFNSHYKVLDENKGDIKYLDDKIEALFSKKFELVDRYSKLAIKESESISDKPTQPARKLSFDALRHEIDREINFYDEQIAQLQKRRSSYWSTHVELQEYLLEQEKTRNEKLDELYKSHTGLLEKLYMRHTEVNEKVAMRTIDSGGETFKFLLDPLNMLLQYFGLSTNIKPSKAEKEIASRNKIRLLQQELNGFDIQSGEGLLGEELLSLNTPFSQTLLPDPT